MKNNKDTPLARHLTESFNRQYFNFLNAESGPRAPHSACIACADARIAPNTLLSVPIGEQFIQKPLGGFLPKDISQEKNLSAWFSLAVGTAKVGKIVLVSHSDCRAGNIALQYPSEADLPADHPQYNDIRDIQNYLQSVGADLSALSRKCLEAADGDVPHAANLMTKELALLSMQNLLDYRVCDNHTKTIRESVAAGETEVILLYVDLKGQRLEYFDADDGIFSPLLPETAEKEIFHAGKKELPENAPYPMRKSVP